MLTATTLLHSSSPSTNIRRGDQKEEECITAVAGQLPCQATWTGGWAIPTEA